MKTRLLLATVVIFALSLGFAVRVRHQVTADRQNLTALAAEQDYLRRKEERLEARLGAAKAALFELEPRDGVNAKPVGHPTVPGSAQAGSGRSDTGRVRVTESMALANDAAKMAQHLKYFRDRTMMNYGANFRAIGLPPEKIERFKDVEVELERARIELQAAVDNHSLDPKSEAVEKLWAEYNASGVTKKAEVLGEFTIPYMDFLRSNSVRELAGKLAMAGLWTGEIATADQIDRAGDILAANSKRTSTDIYPGWTHPATINWEAACEQLKAILTPGQIEIVRLQVESAKFDAKMNDRTKLLTAQFKKQSVPK